MSKELTKKAVELLLKGATLVSDPCPYCKGVRIIKDGNALCVNCGRQAKENNDHQKIENNSVEKTMAENVDLNLKKLSEQLIQETDPKKQQLILKSMNDLIMIKEKLKNI